MKKFLFPLLTVAMLGLASCSSDEPQTGADQPFAPDKIEQMTSLEPLDYVEFSGEEAQANNQINEFSLKFFNAAYAETQKTVQKDENFVISPLSASLFLSMVANSSDGETASSIMAAMGYEDLSALNKVSNQLMRYLPNPNNGSVIHLANSVWYHNEFTPKSEYVTTMNSTFGAEVNDVDMTDPKTVGVLNDWCKQNTKGMITRMWDELPGANLIWMNALYFGGDWHEKFDRELSKPATFHGLNGDKTVNMMQTTIISEYAENDNYYFVTIPYKGLINRMVLALPKNENVLKSDEILSYKQWADAGAALNLVQVRATINLPSFEVEQTIDLQNILPQLGVDLSHVSIAKTGISTFAQSVAAMQKTVTKVNEEGTEGASVTGGWVSGGPTPPKYKEVELTFDRPFLFFVENEFTGSILLAGRVCNF